MPGFSQIRWLFGYGIFAIAGGFFSVRLLELVAAPFLEAKSTMQRAPSSLSERVRQLLSGQE